MESSVLAPLLYFIFRPTVTLNALRKYKGDGFVDTERYEVFVPNTGVDTAA